MLISPERAVKVVFAACALHNMLHYKFPSYTNNLLDREDEVTHNLIPGAWRSDGTLRDVGPLHGNTSLAAAKRQRDELCSFVNGPGAVSWQGRMIGREE